MASLEVYRQCSMCGGDGLFPNDNITYGGVVLPPTNPGPCQTCGGDGKILAYSIEEDFVVKIDDILDKCNDIFEKVNE
jgi:DnaJ-class molecular chaperone